MVRDAARSGMTTLIQVPKLVWSKSLQATVEILKTGHFPDTVIVKTEADNQLELECRDLEI